jgi:hypothetical protein
MPRLLLLTTTTGYQTESFVESARHRGLDLLLGSDRCRALAARWKEPTVPLRFRDPEASARALVEAFRDRPFAGVVALGDETPPTAALACEALGLPFHRPIGARAARDKSLARARLRDAGLATPWCVALEGDADPPAEVPFPVVVKPASLSASRGVIRADDRAGLAAALARVRALLATPAVRSRRHEKVDRVLVEAFVPGLEVAVEGLVTDGRLRVLSIFDKPDPLDGPYFEETIYVTPSRLPGDVQTTLISEVARAVEALGLVHGPIHAEARLSPDGPVVLEVAARPIGGLCARALRFGGAGETPLEDLIVRAAVGDDVHDVPREPQASGVFMIPVSKAGVLERVEGVRDAVLVPGVWNVAITARTGDLLVPWPEGRSYPGFVFARAGTPDEVEAALREAHRRLRFVVARSLRTA